MNERIPDNSRNLDFTDPTNALEPVEDSGVNLESADELIVKFEQKLQAGEELSGAEKASIDEKKGEVRRAQNFLVKDTPSYAQSIATISRLNDILEGKYPTKQ